MARIYYSLAGEGRGHAARVHTVVEHLREEHEIVILAPHDAYDLLEPIYRGSEVRVQRLPGLRFSYRGERVDYLATAWAGLSYLSRLPRLVRSLQRQLEREGVDLVVADFEPALSRAATRAGVPLVSLDRQQFLATTDLSGLPFGSRLWARTIGAIARLCVRGAERTIVSSFHHEPSREARAGLHHVGVLLRPAMRRLRPETGRHLVAYFRRAMPEHVLDTLRTCGREVRIYGLGARRSRGTLHFRAISVDAFTRDLASCAAVLSTAGNQLVGEALSLGKPVFAMPEGGNREQGINAHFLLETGAGRSCAIDDFDQARLADFLAELPSLRRAALAGDWDGTDRALDLLGTHLEARPERTAAPRTLEPTLEFA